MGIQQDINTKSPTQKGKKEALGQGRWLSNENVTFTIRWALMKAFPAGDQ